MNKRTPLGHGFTRRARLRHLTPSRPRWRRWASILLLTALARSPVPAQELPDIAWLDLAELGQIKVTTVSKRAEPAWDVAAALTVLTHSDVRQAGVRTLGDALRLVPGVSAAQINARDWMIGTRGFDQQFANKLLVMIDGRSIYTPLFGGVLWDSADIVLQDLEQIEVIRGPGAAVWGSNAVNGVINIVTKPATDTLGTLLEARWGTVETSGLVRLGEPIDHGAFRIYARYRDFAATRQPDGTAVADAWTKHQLGFRWDRDLADSAHLTVQGDYFSSDGQFPAAGVDLSAPGYTYVDNHTGVRLRGGNLLARWNNLDTAGAGMTLQAIVDSTERKFAVLCEERDTIDLDFQHTQIRDDRILVWGAGFRWSRDALINGPSISLTPPRSTSRRFSTFGQWQQPLGDGDDIDLIIGGRLEDLNYTGWEFQPNLRLAWRPNDRSTLWAAVSQAVRSPTRLETALGFDATVLPGMPAGVIHWNGRPDVASEKLTAFEAGWRVRPAPNLSLDLNVFAHHYDDLIDILPVAGAAPRPGPSPDLVLLDWEYANTLRGTSYGAELAATWQPHPHLRWRLGLTATRVEQSGAPGGLNEPYFEGSTPEQAGFLHLTYAPIADLELFLAGRWVGARPGVTVPAYATLDANLRWDLRPDLSIALRGENLADAAHPEFREGLSNQLFEIRRSVFLTLTWQR